MHRLWTYLRLGLPLGVAAAAGLIKIRAGQLDAALILVVLGGVLLGWSVVLVMESLAALMGLPSRAPAGASLSARRLLQLERDKLQVLRSIKEIEFDAELQRMDASEAAALCEPLRRRALGLLRQLDQARLEKPLSVEQQIQGELERRLDDDKQKEQP